MKMRFIDLDIDPFFAEGEIEFDPKSINRAYVVVEKPQHRLFEGMRRHFDRCHEHVKVFKAYQAALRGRSLWDKLRGRRPPTPRFPMVKFDLLTDSYILYGCLITAPRVTNRFEIIFDYCADH